MMGIIIGVFSTITIGVAANSLITSKSVSYSNSKTSEVTVEGTLNEFFSTVEINGKIGNTNISHVGSTITEAVSNLYDFVDSGYLTLRNINGEITMKSKQFEFSNSEAIVNRSNLIEKKFNYYHLMFQNAIVWYNDKWTPIFFIWSDEQIENDKIIIYERDENGQGITTNMWVTYLLIGTM